MASRNETVYVSDVVEANVKAFEQEEDGIYNIGTGTATSVDTIWERLAQLTDHGKRPKYEPPRKGDVYKIYLDVRKAQHTLGWVPRVSLETGLGLTVNYFRDRS